MNIIDSFKEKVRGKRLSVVLPEGSDDRIIKAAMAKEADISAAESKVRVFVIPANEEAAIANDTYELTK
jgi:acetate kinase